MPDDHLTAGYAASPADKAERKQRARAATHRLDPAMEQLDAAERAGEPIPADLRVALGYYKAAKAAAEAEEGETS